MYGLSLGGTCSAGDSVGASWKCFSLVAGLAGIFTKVVADLIVSSQLIWVVYD